MYSSRLQNVTLSYFTLVTENGQVLQWVRCTVLWPFSCSKAIFRSQHESHTYCHFVSRMLFPKSLELNFYVIDSSTLNGYKSANILSRINPTLLHWSKKSQEFVPYKQEMCCRHEILSVMLIWYIMYLVFHNVCRTD
jgi:hypothetical protein